MGKSRNRKRMRRNAEFQLPMLSNLESFFNPPPGPLPPHQTELILAFDNGQWVNTHLSEAEIALILPDGSTRAFARTKRMNDFFQPQNMKPHLGSEPDALTKLIQLLEGLAAADEADALNGYIGPIYGLQQPLPSSSPSL